MSRYRDRGAYTAPARVAERRESLVRGYMLGALALRSRGGALPVVGEGASAEMIEGLRMAAEGG